MTTFAEHLAQGYGFGGPALTLGAALHEGRTHHPPHVRIPLAMLNRHGLVAGATGTGKTRTLQLLAEQCAAQGIPVFAADVKGDLAGIARPGTAGPRIEERAASVGLPWAPAGAPVEFVSLTGELGAQLRATVSSFGPLMLAKVLDLNDTQTGVLTLVFRYCDAHGLPLLDFADLRTVLQFLGSDEGRAELEGIGGASRPTLGVLLRKMVELEAQGAERFFGEPEFDVRDLLHVTRDGKGTVTCLELADVQDRPRLFSTFLMWLLAELYQVLPEAGDLERPKLVFFFDEAHLLFNDAPGAFLEQVEQVVRLVRSKGVGVFFVTQTPKDVPATVLAQLGNRVQHALRAHTPDDDAAIRATVRTFPKTTFYDLDETLTSLGIGEAVVTALDPRGVPTPVVATRLAAPASRMAPLTPEEFQAELAASDLMAEYGTAVDRESAHEMLARRMERAAEARTEAAREEAAGKSPRARATKSVAAVTVGALAGALGRTVGREVIRGMFGLLGAKPPKATRRRR
ncbi:MAG TPA: helicase HerA-like domain-containing protein [Gemmatimonadales bacterium]|nr:helicase HerA-like domain-containing protein [Gemmatimonadales bacterium]